MLSLDMYFQPTCFYQSHLIFHQITNPIETLSGKLKDGLKIYIALRGARATGLCQIGKSSAPGRKQNAKAVWIVLL
jgi:hypothetical protein